MEVGLATTIVGAAANVELNKTVLNAKMETIAILKIHHRSQITPVSNTNTIILIIFGLKMKKLQTLNVIQKEGLQLVARCGLHIFCF